MGIEVVMANGPDRTMAVMFGRFEVAIRQPQRDASPGEAASSHLMPPGPEERAIWRMAVGMLLFVDIELGILFPVARVLRLAAMATTHHPLQSADAVAWFSS